MTKLIEKKTQHILPKKNSQKKEKKNTQAETHVTSSSSLMFYLCFFRLMFFLKIDV